MVKIKTHLLSHLWQSGKLFELNEMLFVAILMEEMYVCTRGTQRLLSVMTVPFMCNFRILSNKCPTIFLRLVFHILLPKLGYSS